MKAVNFACFKLGEKASKSVKKNKNNFINVIENKLTMSLDEEINNNILQEACINYLQLLI